MPGFKLLNLSFGLCENIIIQFLRRIAPVAVAAASAAPVELNELNQPKLDDFRKRNSDEPHSTNLTIDFSKQNWNL